MQEKLYIFYYPSMTGMGSNVETLLIKEIDLRKIINIELDKKEQNQRFDERLTGTWNNEIFCDSTDRAEVIEDVIRKRLSTNSTYALENDLILIPDNIPIITNKTTVNSIIFRIWNEFGCRRDIIVGEATFHNYIVDTRNADSLGALKSGQYYRFTSYIMKNVLENHFWYKSIKEAITVNQDRLDRLSRGESERSEDLIKISKANIEKLSTMSTKKDEYINHLYKLFDNEFLKEQFEFELRNKEQPDYTDIPYSYPLAEPFIGVIYTHHKEDADLYKYDELFEKGMEVECLTGSLVQSSNNLSDFNNIQVPSTLSTVFGYD